MPSSTARQQYSNRNTHQPTNRRREIAKIRNSKPPKPTPRKKPPQQPDEFARLRQDMPKITKKGNVYYVLDSPRGQYKMPRPLIVSIVVIFLCAIISVASQVYLSSIERQVATATTRLLRLEEANDALESQIGVHYTDDRIEEIAITQLGMIFPDQSQIIEIYVPRISTVEFNTNQQFLPSENYFWRDIGTFINGMLDRVFGG